MFRAKRAKKEASAVAEEENMTEEVKQVKKERYVELIGNSLDSSG